ncbi:RES family NAD+ phosphorylase [Pontibacter sp. SGAir0037]|uniref:RES family NAD+ phosphorylase n=1 Tax=Pontibacter sp. SGAir0037 TaxID=2571030 RepID=UPI001F10F310|nr:RES family NAD+ phosphorylase [Pontibacter sp. SGAir0037]
MSKGKFANDLSGRGAELAGGRWNSKGVPVLYTSESIALCTVEVAVHMPLGIVPQDYKLVHIALPDTASITQIDLQALPVDWKSFPHINATQEIGDQFIDASTSLVLKVPSATVQGNYNYLINPRHSAFQQIEIVKIEPFDFDKRLFVKT